MPPDARLVGDPGEPRELFVLGCPRSGTTLVAGLLDLLPGVWIGKETGFIPRFVETGMETLHDWDTPRLEKAVARVNAHLRNQAWTSLATVAGVRQFWSETGLLGYEGLIRYVWSLEVPSERPRPTVVGDQSPEYVLAIPLLEQLFPRALYLHIVRDPRDVVSSVLPLHFGAHSAAIAALYWNESVAAWWAAERRVPAARRFEVRYEDLVAEPAAVFRAMAGFLVIAPRGPVERQTMSGDAHGLARSWPHHARLAEPIDDRSVGRHRRDLSDRQRALVEAICYTGLVTYGYEVGPFRPSPVLEEKALLLTGERLRDLCGRALGAARRRWRSRA